ncbi:GTPase ObgE [Candidatus Riflebacteria bacterium]
MKFVDEVQHIVKGGRGGRGKIAFRREKYVPYGGPAGGDGGNGGSVWFRLNSSYNTLAHLSGFKDISAADGENGREKNCHGAAGNNMYVEVPAGTQIIDIESRELLAEITPEIPEFMLCQGGRGGRGNYSLASHKNKAPKRAENGERGECKNVLLRLALLADVGIIGLPNAGKSTLIASISNARPKIADYPFTTIIPALGVVQVGDFDSYLCVDIPGIIANASEGKGLGLHFLRHVEKTKILIHLISAESFIAGDPEKDFLEIEREIKKYDQKLPQKKRILAISKMDLNPDTDECNKFLQQKISQYPSLVKGLLISSVSRQGILQLKNESLKVLAMENIGEENITPAPIKKYRLKEELSVEKLDDNTYRINSQRLERLVDRTQYDNSESIQHFINALHRWGIIDLLQKQGMRDEILIHMGENAFTWEELNQW